jgi:hypothetical protein
MQEFEGALGQYQTYLPYAAKIRAWTQTLLSSQQQCLQYDFQT